MKQKIKKRIIKNLYFGYLILKTYLINGNAKYTMEWCKYYTTKKVHQRNTEYFSLYFSIFYGVW